MADSNADFWTHPIETGEVPENGSNFDAIVVGGGPGGSSAAGYLAMEGKKVLLIEKDVWPRDKICGDAVGGKSLSHVKALGVKQTLESTPHFRVTGIKFSSPNGKEVRVALPEEDVQKLEAGYSLPRQQFDYLLFKNTQELVRKAGGAVIQGAEVRDVILEDKLAKGVEVRIGGRKGEMVSFFSDEIIGAAGYRCPVAKTLVETIHDEKMLDRRHYCGGYREYWENVKGCEGNVGDIEIHFVDTVVPGYFWLFPVSKNITNVGIGMVMSLMDKQGKKLKALQKDVIQNHPNFAHRFENAKFVEGSGKGWQLPFGSPRKKADMQPRRMAGNNIRLVGDAASLVDPFSGEGIGNALLSGKLASDHIIQGKPYQDYQKEIWEILGPELTNSLRMQNMSRKKWLINWFVGKAGKKPEIQEMMTEMIASKETQENLHSPIFMLKTLLF
ncbi:MAG: hypothetical protein CMB73_05975 [Euryarchaeota archaeon]|nr:hypothetical protein [Euryarchaeota archaeon]|tara:strand:+ start:2047 stop:3375 length:1329 start_codon:yes stop_codon:yes gene_type:complete